MRFENCFFFYLSNIILIIDDMDSESSANLSRIRCECGLRDSN